MGGIFIMPCVICDGELDVHRDTDGNSIWDGGHNAEPVAEGRCCTDCNNNVVIPARIKDGK